jgi:hypothetical protein
MGECKGSSIIFANAMETLTFNTKNDSSIYSYDSFLKMSSSSLGIEKGALAITFALKR